MSYSIELDHETILHLDAIIDIFEDDTHRKSDRKAMMTGLINNIFWDLEYRR